MKPIGRMKLNESAESSLRTNENFKAAICRQCEGTPTAVCLKHRRQIQLLTETQYNRILHGKND